MHLKEMVLEMKMCIITNINTMSIITLERVDKLSEFILKLGTFIEKSIVFP